MNWRRVALLSACISITMSSIALGQGGGVLDSRTQYEIVLGAGHNNQHGPLLAVVLWRGEEGWNQPHTAGERARSDSIFRWTRLHAEESRQSFFGSGLWYGLLDQDNRAVTIEGKHLALSAGDSALVVMVTVSPNNLPRSVDTVSVALELPSEFWTKQWQSGDTTFFVHPDFRRQQAMLRAGLTRSAVVAAFLHRAPPPPK